MTFQEFHDPRLVALYDSWGLSRADTQFYVGLAAELAASSVVDIGCGTGEVTCELAQQGYYVTGVDPSRAMLEVARRRPGGELVRWIEGAASRLDGAPADLAIMTAHVAQVIHNEDDWRATLEAVHGALRPGGHLAFESRNPRAQAWLAWTPDASHGRLQQTPLGPVEVWFNLLGVDGDLVDYEIHYRITATGEHLISTNKLRFRTREALTRSLVNSGFHLGDVYGDWDRSPPTPASPELIFVAVRE